MPFAMQRDAVLKLKSITGPGHCACGFAMMAVASTRVFCNPGGPDILGWPQCATARRELTRNWISSVDPRRERKLNGVFPHRKPIVELWMSQPGGVCGMPR